MKKALSIILSALMAAGFATASMAAPLVEGTDYISFDPASEEYCAEAFGDSYPGSLDWDWVEVTSGQLLKGTVIQHIDANGLHTWNSDGTINGVQNASYAFDGDSSTYVDGKTWQTWWGLDLGEAYELTEVRVMPRESWLKRTNDCVVEGSNDLETWVTIIALTDVAEAPAGYDYNCFTPETNADYTAYYTDYGIEQPDMSEYWVGEGSYRYYRWRCISDTNGGRGDVGEIEFYGNPAPANTVLNSYEKKFTDLHNWIEKDPMYVSETKNVADGDALVGTIIGGGGAYSDSASYECAWDGDVTTFYDPSTAAPKCFTGIKVDEAVSLAEVHLLPRIGQNARSKNMYVQGSNDGIVWEDICMFEEADCLPQSDEIDDAEEQAWIVKASTNANAYTMFRYVSDGTSHGDVAELKFIPGTPAVVETEAPETEAPVETETETDAPVVETEAETEAPVETEAEVVETEPEVVETEAPVVEEEVAAPQTFDFGVIAAVAAIVSAAGYAISKKRN